MKTRFEIIATVEGKGRIKHIVPGEDATEARERFKRAYPGKAIADMRAKMWIGDSE